MLAAVMHAVQGRYLVSSGISCSNILQNMELCVCLGIMAKACRHMQIGGACCITNIAIMTCSWYRIGPENTACYASWPNYQDLLVVEHRRCPIRDGIRQTRQGGRFSSTRDRFMSSCAPASLPHKQQGSFACIMHTS